MTEPVQTAVENTGTGAAVSIRLVGTDKPLITALAFAIGLVAILLAYQAKTEARLSQYEYEQLREFMSQKGYPLPPDPSKPVEQK